VYSVPFPSYSAFAIVILLGCIARIAFVGKTVGIERDWIVISQSRGIDLNRTSRASLSNLDVNVVMRRINIDLCCKLAGPLFVSVITIPSVSFAAIFLAASNISSLPFQYYFILGAQTFP
jgi:iron-regulated transporter 1